MPYYTLPKDIKKLRSDDGSFVNIPNQQGKYGNNPSQVKIIERKEYAGNWIYKVKLLPDGPVGWTPGSGIDPEIVDLEDDLLDGRFNP